MSNSQQAVSAEQMMALVLLVKELLAQVDEIACLLRQGAEAKLSRHLFAEMSSVVRQLEPNLRARYFELLLKFSMSQETPDRVRYTPEYVQAVETSKKRLVKRLQQQLSSEAA